MSRRMDREGLHRMEPQAIQNRRFWDDPRCKEDERGWVQPFTVWQGWEEFNRARYALWCVMLYGKVNRTELRGMVACRIESDIRTFRCSIERSSRCDRPKLP